MDDASLRETLRKRCGEKNRDGYSAGNRSLVKILGHFLRSEKIGAPKSSHRAKGLKKVDRKLQVSRLRSRSRLQTAIA